MGTGEKTENRPGRESQNRFTNASKLLFDRKGSTFVAIGALLGIKSVRGDAEHVVALDADAVDHGADDSLWPGRFDRTRWMRIGDFFDVRLSCHGAILSYGNFVSHTMFQEADDAGGRPLFRVEDRRSRASTALSMKVRSFSEVSERRSTASLRCASLLCKCRGNVGQEKMSNTNKESLLTGSGQATHIEKAALLLLKSGMMYFGAHQAGPSKPRTNERNAAPDRCAFALDGVQSTGARGKGIDG